MLKASVGETPTADAAVQIDKLGSLEIKFFISFMATFHFLFGSLFLCVINATDHFFNTETILRIILLLGVVSFLYLDLYARLTKAIL